MLQAYIDDSASEVGDRRLFLAGYVNTDDKWIAFSDEWNRALETHPSIDYLHMVEAQGFRGQFNGWSEKDRSAKILALASVIERYRFWWTAASVSRVEYESILAPAAPYPLKNPYFACFWGVLQTLARYHAGLSTADMPSTDFIFDEQGGLGQGAALWFEWIKKEQPPELRRYFGSTPIFCSDREVVALQAADMLAWHLRRSRERPGTALPAFEKLVGEGAGVHVDAEALRMLAHQMASVPNVDLVQTKRDWQRLKPVIVAMVDAGMRAPHTGQARMRILRVVRDLVPIGKRLRRLAKWYLRI